MAAAGGQRVQARSAQKEVHRWPHPRAARRMTSLMIKKVRIISIVLILYCDIIEHQIYIFYRDQSYYKKIEHDQFEIWNKSQRSTI